MSTSSMSQFINSMSIRRKLVFIILLVSTVTFFVGGLITTVFAWYVVKNSIEEDVIALTKVVGENSTAALDFDDPVGGKQVLSSLRAKRSIEYAWLFRADGELFLSYSRDDLESGEVVAYRPDAGLEYIGGHLVIWQPIEGEDYLTGGIMLQSDQSEIRVLFSRILITTAISLVFSFLIAYLLAMKLQRTISGPLDVLAGTAIDISESKNYSVRAVRRTDDEIGTLTTAFNEMLDQVELRDSALTESQERYRAFVESSSEPTFRIDYDPPIPTNLSIEDQIRLHKERAVIAETNSAFLSLYGYANYEEVSGSGIGGYLSDAVLRSALSIHLPATNIDTTITNALGVQKTLLTSITRTSEDGLLSRIWVTQRDVTDLRLAEEEQDSLEKQLRHAQKMDSVGQLAGGIAHDFNNLLVVIAGYIELLVSIDSTNGVAEPTPTYHLEIEKAAQRAAGLTRQLLAFSRRQIMEMSDVDINNVLSEIQKIIGRLLPESIVLEIRSGESSVTVNADAGQLEQVIVNLVVNARDAMPSGGEIEIAVESLVLDRAYVEEHPWATIGEFAVISVSDTGIGMTKEVQEMLFEPFFTTKPEGKGTGLGLSVAFGIVKQHQGFIHTYSEVEVGSCMKVYLPIVVKSHESHKVIESVEPSSGSETILLVEDEKQVRTIAKMILERAGYHVLEAEDGVVAMEIFREREVEIDLLISDVVMPRMGGKELMDAVRLTNKDVPILFSSGYSGGGIHDKFVLEEGLDFLPKPYSYKQLQAKVREVIDSRSRQV